MIFFIEAVKIENGGGFPVRFISAIMTIKGRTYLEELEQKETLRIELPKQI
jgi:hypothetical protein